MQIITSTHNLSDELLLVAKLFMSNSDIENSNLTVVHEYTIKDNYLFTKISLGSQIATHQSIITNEKKDIKEWAKILLYNLLSKNYKKKMSWGALTGVRPTKLYYDLQEINNKKNIKNILSKKYKVSKAKINQLSKIVANQYTHMQKIKNCTKNTIDMYIHIPFCTTKCYYCSFVSLPLKKCKNQLQPYVTALCKEINSTLKHLKTKKYTVENIYIGGGTPTALPAKALEQILQLLPKVQELTVECGRVDTITKEKLDVLHKYNVGRICINPQTFNDQTLKKIGRSHTAQDVINTYNLAKNYPFIINMDLIAGLVDENFKNFKRSLDTTIKLAPHNITVHTLSVKRGSDLANDNNTNKSSDKETKKMVEYATKKLAKSNYKPYYLYRQKNMLSNLENIGYYLHDSLCAFNVNSMEEVRSVIACGAGGISKKIDKTNNNITRTSNTKDLQAYITNISEIIIKKHQLFG